VFVKENIMRIEWVLVGIVRMEIEWYLMYSLAINQEIGI
jgi:hypothetical protein